MINSIVLLWPYKWYVYVMLLCYGYVMLCYLMLCYLMLRLCYVMLCYVITREQWQDLNSDTNDGNDDDDNDDDNDETDNEIEVTDANIDI